jgi:hypothetical protein
MTVKSSMISDRQQLIMMKEILSIYVYKVKDKNILFHKDSITLVVIECFIMLHVFTKNM